MFPGYSHLRPAVTVLCGCCAGGGMGWTDDMMMTVMVTMDDGVISAGLLCGLFISRLLGLVVI